MLRSLKVAVAILITASLLGSCVVEKKKHYYHRNKRMYYHHVY